ncbi:tRNA 5-methoxyuridine(34)/uridine 5-oxyacetic acid(34) synthase CmoB [Roseiconus nitratireducens]|uniref:tRNA 5-methoxyuridine(34)/uridine 5-oxyacetic acid(34) synthase CmoB n=1 Tax=Roseiconus nitratireducens TaxID=2605748 RepID=A0A5M6CVM0_9BACT|nr:tRNA 5-methoxyuridine(34)/uridine 5-oxyacetic acid(34) synthase CmoB [Roseiconus nitratireducens]KAA5539284.1 tRNA 5-methoxyuridine(34)/uridine 5-oxyacetic acid(34) synthase CmoB [Roseiconus nitratireducens]
MKLPSWLAFEPLRQRLVEAGMEEFADHIQALCAERLNQPTNGDLKRWVAALEELPAPSERWLDASGSAVRVDGAAADDPAALRETLMKFHPWRKGPFDFLGVEIDTEWRSDSKWDRIAGSIDLNHKSVLDVGCGNGYFGWRMLDAGASWVLGMDPILRYVLQFEVFRRYAGDQPRHDVLPLLDTDLPPKLHGFDVVFSMGVLYHRTSPIDHLRSLAGALKPGGNLILETLIIDDDQPSVLVPEDRYAQMRNVWFLPSLPMLQRWLRRTGFDDITPIDVTTTTQDEQRSTPWMTFQSLPDFLDPQNPGRTVEGYPGPRRAVVTARAPKRSRPRRSA